MENDNLMAGGNGWWIILLFILLGGWGNSIGGGTGAATNYVLNSDMSQIENKLDGITNGLSQGFYTQAELVNGLNSALVNQGHETRQAINNFQAQMASNCCELKQDISGLKFEMAMNNNALQNSICQSTRDILDELRAQSVEAKNTRIAELERQLSMANLNASQVAQTAYLESKIAEVKA